MNKNDKAVFDKVLDQLSDLLHVSRQGDEVKNGYFKALASYSCKQFIDSANKLAQEYKPRRHDDFPVIVVFQETIGSRKINTRSMWDCICCQAPFPAAAFAEMKCACNRFVCWDCQRCENHCACEKGIKTYPPLELAPKDFGGRSGRLRLVGAAS